MQMTKLNAVKPFGDIQTAKVLLVGQDPRLQRSKAEAEYAFFFEYLSKYDECPTHGSHASKYKLAKAVWDYINELTEQKLPLESLYVTNLCNPFLPSTRGGGIVLIPDDLAQQGVDAICKIIEQGHFSVIVPMSMQTFYHLCRLDFLDDNDERIQSYIDAAQPNQAKARDGSYVAIGKAPFLEVCGQRFHHRGVPVVPVLHVKQWPIKKRFVRYTEPMQRAQKEISAIFNHYV